MNANYFYRRIEARSDKRRHPEQPPEKRDSTRRDRLEHQRQFTVGGRIVWLTYSGALR